MRTPDRDSLFSHHRKEATPLQGENIFRLKVTGTQKASNPVRNSQPTGFTERNCGDDPLLPTKD